MAFLFTETGMISRFLLHHVRGHYLRARYERGHLQCDGVK